MKHTLAEQGKASSAIHRPLDEFQFCHMPFGHSIVDWAGQNSLYCVFILFYSGSRGLEFWQLALRYPGQPGI